MKSKVNHREKIISLLEKRGSLYLGDITKEISVSPRSGYKFIEELMLEGVITHQPDSSRIILTV